MSKPDIDAVLRTIETQATVIELLSGALDETVALLMQHITVEEAEHCTGLAMMRQAAQLRNSLRGGGGPHEPD